MAEFLTPPQNWKIILAGIPILEEETFEELLPNIAFFRCVRLCYSFMPTSIIECIINFRIIFLNYIYSFDYFVILSLSIAISKRKYIAHKVSTSIRTTRKRKNYVTTCNMYRIECHLDWLDRNKHCWKISRKIRSQYVASFGY